MLRTRMASDPEYVGCDRRDGISLRNEVSSMEGELLRLAVQTSGEKRYYTSAMFLRGPE